MKRTFPRTRLRNIIKNYQRDGKLSKNVDILVRASIQKLKHFQFVRVQRADMSKLGVFLYVRRFSWIICCSFVNLPLKQT